MIQGFTYREKTVRLDGKHFKDCTFADCILEYSGGDVILERVSMLSCKHTLIGYARQTANYMRSVGLCENARDKWTEYTGTIN